MSRFLEIKLGFMVNFWIISGNQVSVCRLLVGVLWAFFGLFQVGQNVQIFSFLPRFLFRPFAPGGEQSPSQPFFSIVDNRPQYRHRQCHRLGGEQPEFHPITSIRYYSLSNVVVDRRKRLARGRVVRSFSRQDLVAARQKTADNYLLAESFLV